VPSKGTSPAPSTDDALEHYKKATPGHGPLGHLYR
jgi:hypothetical protein